MPAEGAITTPVTDLARPRFERGPDAVVVDEVVKAFGPVVALDGLSLRVGAGETVAVVGPSGSGKSTLLELVCGLTGPTAGRVRAERAVLMPQRDLLLPWLSALDNAALAPRLAGARPEAARERARPLFARFGLAGFEAARPHELSGGMRQRVAFLRTLLAGTPVLCLDEPFAALDAITRMELRDWLRATLEAEPRAVLLVTHDVDDAVALARRVLVLSPRPGRVVAEVPPDRERVLAALRS